MIKGEMVDGSTFALSMARSIKARAALVERLRATMTHRVVYCEGGCWREDRFHGSRTACLAYLRKHWYSADNKHGNTLDLQNVASGRFESFVL